MDYNGSAGVDRLLRGCSVFEKCFEQTFGPSSAQQSELNDGARASCVLRSYKNVQKMLHGLVDGVCVVIVT